MPDDLVTIRTLGDAALAEMYRDILEQEGIVAMIPGAQHRSMLGMVGAYIEIPLKVAAADAARAAEIMDAIESEEAALDEDGDWEDDEDEYDSDDDSDSDDEDGDNAYAVRGKLKRIAFFIAFVIPGGGHIYLRRWALGGLFLAGQLGGGLALALGGESLLAVILIPGLVLSDALGAVSRVREANGGAPASGLGARLSQGLPVVVLLVVGLILGLTEQAPAWVAGESGRTACARLRACSGQPRRTCELRIARKLRRGEVERRFMVDCAHCLKRTACDQQWQECAFLCARARFDFGAGDHLPPPAYPPRHPFVPGGPLTRQPPPDPDFRPPDPD